MNPTVERFLVKMPSLYKKAMRLKPNYNREKYVFACLSKKGDILFDAGANKGHYTCFFSRWVGPKGQVHAFEPIPNTFKMLEDRCQAEQLPSNYFLNAVALGQKEGEVTMFIPQGNDEQASLREHEEGSWSDAQDDVQKCAVPMTTLDAYAQEKGIYKLDFIKMDLEGAEHAAFLGSGGLLQEFQPLIHVELCSDWLKDFGVSPKAILDYLKSFGYDTFIAYTSDLVRDPAVNDQIENEESVSVDMVCANRSRHDSRLSCLGW
tara:strand:+ start:1322 stop:2110 length:789 start_codon:yes stop_codon:yes gene_type:complete